MDTLGDFQRLLGRADPLDIPDNEQRRFLVYALPRTNGVITHEVSKLGIKYFPASQLRFNMTVRTFREGKFRGYSWGEDLRTDKALKRFRNTDYLSLLEAECLKENFSRYNIIRSDAVTLVDVFWALELPKIRYVVGMKGKRNVLVQQLK